MRLLLDPQDVDGGAVEQEAPEQQAAETTSTYDAMRGEPEAAETTDSGSSGIAEVQAKQEAEWQSIRDAASAQGYQFPQDVADDGAALNHLLKNASRAQQEDFYGQLGRRLAPQAERIEEYLKRQQKPAPEAPSYEPPAWDERWASLVQYDESTGMVVGKPGVPSNVVDAVQKRVDWEREFKKNPIEVTRKANEDYLSKMVEERLGNYFEKYRREEQARQIHESNSGWLYERDSNSQVRMGYDGNPVLSPMGRAYVGHLQSLRQAGVTDPVKLDEFARMYTGAQFARQQAAAPAPKRETPQTRQARGGSNRNVANAKSAPDRAIDPAASTTPYGTRPSHKMMKEMLESMEAEGVRDEDIFGARDGGANRPTGFGLGT